MAAFVLLAIILVLFLVAFIRILQLTPDGTWKMEQQRIRIRSLITREPAIEQPHDWIYKHRLQKVKLFALFVFMAILVIPWAFWAFIVVFLEQ